LSTATAAVTVAAVEAGPTRRARPPARARRALARRALPVAALIATLGAALAGCGSSSPVGTAADPAAAVPASAALYVGATVRPGGAQKTAALAAGAALTHQADPYLRLLAALQTPGSPQLSFTRDVAPWLGPHAGVFLSSLGASSSALLSLLEQGLLGTATTGAFPFSAGGAQGALVLDTSDVSRARSFLDTQATRAGAHAASYRGVAYQVSSAGVAFGLVDRFAVIGNEAGLRSVIDTTLGGSSLAHTGDYAKLLAAAPADALGHLYSNPAAVTASRSAGSRQAAAGEGLAGLVTLLTGTREADVSLVPSASSLTLDADTVAAGSGGAAGSSGAAGGLLAVDPEGAHALAELPGESWLAIGLGHVGATLEQDVQGLRTLGSLFGSGSEGASTTDLSLNLGSIVQALTTPLGVLAGTSAQARRDFASWMGSGGIFASGASLLELRAAVVIASKDPAASRAAVADLADQLRAAGVSAAPATIAGTEAAIAVRLSGLPLVLDIADGRDSAGQPTFVLGIGEASVQDALHPPSALAGTAPYDAAAAALGEGIQPSLIVDFPTLLSLLEGLGLTESAGISRYVPYLRASTTLAGGGRRLGGEVERFRLVLGLQAGG
jgi:hypothetical protein